MHKDASVATRPRTRDCPFGVRARGDAQRQRDRPQGTALPQTDFKCPDAL